MPSRIVSYLGIIGVCILLIYHPVYRFDFLYGWDDQWFVTNYYTEEDFSAENLWAIFTEFYKGQYAPFNQLYYTSLYSLFQYQTGIFHVFSVLIHFINGILVYLLSRNLRKQLNDEPPATLDLMSFLTALLFVVLPINVEAVAWVSAAKVLWYAFFYLLAILMYIRYIKNKRHIHFYAVLLFFTMSFLSKEQAVAIPLTLVLVDWVYRRDLKSSELWLEKIPFFILAVLFGLVTIASQDLGDGQRLFYPLYQRIPLALFTVSEYITKSIFPINLSYLYPFPFHIGDPVNWWMWIYVLFAPFIIYSCFKLKNRSYIFLLLFFLINIILVINLMSIARHSVIADRYTYISSIAVTFLLTDLFFKLLKSRRRLALIISIVYITTMMGYSAYHVTTWRDAYSVKERLKKTIEDRPDFEELEQLK